MGQDKRLSKNEKQDQERVRVQAIVNSQGSKTVLVQMPAFNPDAAAADDDRHSTSTVASTVGTTASLSSRLAALTMDLDRESMGRGITETEGEGEFEEEDVVEVKEEELMGLLDAERNPLETCSRLFLPVGSNPIPLKKLSMTHVEQLRQHGYVIVDGFVGQETAQKIRSETLNLSRRGKLAKAAVLNAPEKGHDIYTDRKARGDNILWLHLGESPANSVAFAPLMVGFQKLLEDLVEIMHLKHKSTWFFYSDQWGSFFLELLGFVIRDS
eukprot:TRINITY_DN3512_c0_g1_i1.p1 TRINITY_DN3512_c0_g1~~TRINITY_DN3512_c0_g1_i1.p1  ORF type:complete len:270 (+),score=45.46 TRINITY_DN3512_c0_g1_i1:67-876(+)